MPSLSYPPPPPPLYSTPRHLFFLYPFLWSSLRCQTVHLRPPCVWQFLIFKRGKAGGTMRSRGRYLLFSRGFFSSLVVVRRLLWVRSFRVRSPPHLSRDRESIDASYATCSLVHLLLLLERCMGVYWRDVDVTVRGRKGKPKKKKKIRTSFYGSRMNTKRLIPGV